jgi:hypothetical protein
MPTNEEQTPTGILAIALEYARKGMPVVPMEVVNRPDGKVAKKPTIRGWLERATTDPEAIRALFAESPHATMVGAVIGPESGIWVLDIDSLENHAHDGEASLRVLQAEHGPMPPTVQVATPGGGRHLWFLWPRGVDKIKSSNSELGPGLDVLGSGKLAILPDSVGQGGRRYEMTLGPHTGNPVADAPRWLLGKVAERPRRPERVGAGEDLIPEGKRNATLTAIAGRLRRTGMSVDSIEAALQRENDDRCYPSLPEQEVRAIARSVARYEPGDPVTVKVPEERSAPPLIEIDLRDIEIRDIAPPHYPIASLLPRCEVSLLGGHGSSGKSLLELVWAVHVAAGRPWADLEVSAGRVLVVSMEDRSEVVLWRLQRILRVYGISSRDLKNRLTLLDGSASEPLAVETSSSGARGIVMTETLNQLEALVGAGAYDLVIIDNASDAYAGDENNRRQVRTFMRRLASLARENNAAVLLLAHVDKVAARYGSNNNTYAGSTAWHNSARSRLALVSEDGQLLLAQEKHNLGRSAEPIPLLWTDNGVLIPDQDGTAAEQQRRQVQASDEEAVLECLRVYTSSGGVVSTSQTGPYSAARTLRDHPDFPAVLRDDRGVNRCIHAALLRLEKSSVIRRVKYKRDYKEREKWMPVEAARKA